MTFTDGKPNRTEPNRWPRRQQGADAQDCAPARARVAENEEGSTRSKATESERPSGLTAVLTEVRDALLEGVDKAWPENAEAIRRYGKTGEHLGKESKLRPLSVAWANGPGVAMTWVNVWRAWVWQRWFRFLALVGVIVLVNLLIPGTTPLWAWAFLIGFLL